LRNFKILNLLLDFWNISRDREREGERERERERKRERVKEIKRESVRVNG
jgi:hypothetical protein